MKDTLKLIENEINIWSQIKTVEDLKRNAKKYAPVSSKINYEDLKIMEFLQIYTINSFFEMGYIELSECMNLINLVYESKRIKTLIAKEAYKNMKNNKSGSEYINSLHIRLSEIESVFSDYNIKNINLDAIIASYIKESEKKLQRSKTLNLADKEQC